MQKFDGYRNHILRKLEPEVIQRLSLRPKRLKSKDEIELPGEEVHSLYFLETGMASLTITFEDGAQAEAGLFGCESVIGVSSLVGPTISLNNVYMQSDGTAYVCTMDAAVKEFKRYSAFHDLILRFLQAQLIQTSQTAGCNARHTIPHRLARWLLLCQDRMGSSTLQLTQEFLGHMLGVRRTSVQAAVEGLEHQGLISSTRGSIVVLNRAELEKQSCECYRVVSSYLAHYSEMEASQSPHALAG